MLKNLGCDVGVRGGMGGVGGMDGVGVRGWYQGRPRDDRWPCKGHSGRQMTYLGRLVAQSQDPVRVQRKEGYDAAAPDPLPHATPHLCAVGGAGRRLRRPAGTEAV